MEFTITRPSVKVLMYRDEVFPGQWGKEVGLERQHDLLKVLGCDGPRVALVQTSKGLPSMFIVEVLHKTKQKWP